MEANPCGVTISGMEGVAQPHLALGRKVHFSPSSLLELHESAGQTLAALKMTLANLEYALRENTEEVPRHLQAARAQAEDAIREIRVISYLMHPPMLDELGLGQRFNGDQPEFLYHDE